MLSRVLGTRTSQSLRVRREDHPALLREIVSTFYAERLVMEAYEEEKNQFLAWSCRPLATLEILKDCALWHLIILRDVRWGWSKRWRPRLWENLHTASESTGEDFVSGKNNGGHKRLWCGVYGP